MKEHASTIRGRIRPELAFINTLRLQQGHTNMLTLTLFILVTAATLYTAINLFSEPSQEQTQARNDLPGINSPTLPPGMKPDSRYDTTQVIYSADESNEINPDALYEDQKARTHNSRQSRQSASPGAATIARSNKNPAGRASDETSSGQIASLTKSRSSDSHNRKPQGTPRNPAENTPANEDYDGGFAISGQVLDESGWLVPGIEVIASVRNLFEQQATFNFNDSTQEQHTLTDGSGFFQFSGLENGEYDIRTVETGNYLAASKTIRTGIDSVKLVIVEQREIMIDGYVTNDEGEGLASVAVYSTDNSQPATVSDPNGWFMFPVTLRSDRSHTLSLRAEGYREKKISLTPNDWKGKQQAEVDVVMQPESALTRVSGVLLSASGEPVAGEQIYLKRLQTKYKATSDATGRFIFNNVGAGTNYTLWLNPTGPYQKHMQDHLNVSAAGVSGLRILLTPLGSGSVVGQMLDPRGNAVPNFTLMVRSEQAQGSALQVTSEQDGYFEIDSVPDGRLRFESGSFPRFIISGIQLDDGEQEDVDLILDLGNQQINGRVVDHQGIPVATADITLSWVLRENGLVHESLRKTTTSVDGDFMFTRLSDEARTIIVRAAGFQIAKLEQRDIGNIEIKLDPLAQ